MTSSGQIDTKGDINNQITPKEIYNKTNIVFNSFMNLFDNIYKKIFLILKLLLVCFIAIYVWHLALWMFYPDDGIDVQPFVIRDVSLGENTLMGEALADRLRFELVRIKEINEHDIYSPTFSSSSKTNIARPKYLPSISNHSYSVAQPTNLDSSISQLGTFGGGGFSFSLGQILLSLKDLSGNRKNTVKGSFQKYGNNLSMVAMLIDSNARNGLEAWEVKRILPSENSSGEELIPDMIDELSFRIAHATSEGRKAQTWEAFKYGILAKEAYANYNATVNTSDLYEATRNALLASSYEVNCPGSIELLRNLENAWNNKGNDLALEKKYNEGQAALDESIYLNKTIRNLTINSFSGCV